MGESSRLTFSEGGAPRNEEYPGSQPTSSRNALFEPSSSVFAFPADGKSESGLSVAGKPASTK